MERAEFKAKAKKKIDDLFSKIEELEDRKEQLKDDVRKEYEQHIFDLKVKKAELEMEFNALEQETEDKWESVKQSFSASAESFGEGLAKIGSFFK